jgi:mRNA degradation ribonuclease J1/J2
MVRNMGIAADLGYLNVPDGVLIDYKKAVDLPDDRIVYMSTGSQGEPMAVLSRMANLEHQIEIGPGDTVILASSLIPGNENAVYRVIDGLTRLGANVAPVARADCGAQAQRRSAARVGQHEYADPPLPHPRRARGQRAVVPLGQRRAARGAA